MDANFLLWISCGYEEQRDSTGNTAEPATSGNVANDEAATCTVCGKTEGEPKQSYFDEHGAEVAYQKTTDATWEQIDCYSEPAEEEGYQLVYLELCASIQLYYDAEKNIDYGGGAQIGTGNIYDWYTGCKFPGRSTISDDVWDYGITLEIDGVNYDVAYTKDIRWEPDDWVYNDSGDGTRNLKNYITFTFKVPDGYDGLVFATVPKNEFTEFDTETVHGADDAIYAFDESYIDGTKFFRINKEGMVLERLPENSTDSTQR